ncbi:metal-dependent phosphohydrolase [Colwellia phage 9A]|uniref:Metal dependent phosphohydrolase n=1 Tax=Colwellia phage 9A TaxID=765765 RepID=I3UMA3_9CAUD|nr:metal-dependent phosphohydrolase [Colwellia phage 9A]AFK66618.1 metal dependent phosphohydrolase [Colwellia phage 9A]
MNFSKKLPENFTAVQFYEFIAELAYMAHNGQKYGEKNYTYHLKDVESTFMQVLNLDLLESLRVSQGLDHLTLEDLVLYLRAACLGHDMFEDTWVTGTILRDKGCPEWFIAIIKAVTKTKGMSQVQYLNIVLNNPLAVLIKTPDSLSNLKHSIQSGWIKGVIKYCGVLRFLKGDATLVQ